MSIHTLQGGVHMKIGTDSYLQQTQNYAAYSKQTKAAEETKTEAKVETTPVFTSSSTFSTSSIVNGPNQNNNLA